MVHEGRNRWYHDGWNARLNGRMRCANPRSSDLRFNTKAMLWDKGWEAADTMIRGMTEWDHEQDIINQLIIEAEK